MRYWASSAAAEPRWRRVLRRGLTAVLILGVALNGLAAWRTATDPRFAPLVERGTAEFRARLDRALAAEIDDDWIAGRVEAGLSTTPRDWVLIDMAREESATRGLPLPEALAARLARAEAAERSALAAAEACIGCVLWPAACPVSGAMLCNIAVEVTPVGDVRSLVRGGIAWQAGDPVDRIDVALATVGLAATAGTLVTAGTSYAVKAGAGIAKVARAAGTLGAGFAARVARMSDGLIDWRRMPADPTDWQGVSAAIDRTRLAALTALAEDLGGVVAAAGPVRAVRLMRHVDGPAEARLLRRTADAAGPRMAVAVEALGMGRLARLSVRWSRALREAALGLLGAFAALTGLGLSVAGGIGARMGRRALRRRQAWP